MILNVFTRRWAFNRDGLKFSISLRITPKSAMRFGLRHDLANAKGSKAYFNDISGLIELVCDQ